MEIVIRKATLSDVPDIHKVAWIVFPETYKEILSQEQTEYMMEWMYSEENLKRQMTEEHHTYLLAYMGEKLVGYVSVQPENQGVWHLQKIYVLPEMQGTGLGKRLFQAAVSEVKSQENGPFQLRLNVNRYNRALHFYEHLGMKKVYEGDFDIGNGYYMNDYIMAIDIDEMGKNQ